MSCVHVALFSDEEKPQNHSQWSVSCYLQVTIVLVWTLLIWWIVLWAQQCGDGSKVTASREVMIQTSLWVIKSVAPGVILTHHMCLRESIPFFDFLFFMNPSPTQTLWWQIIVAVIKPERASLLSVVLGRLHASLQQLREDLTLCEAFKYLSCGGINYISKPFEMKWPAGRCEEIPPNLHFLLPFIISIYFYLLYICLRWGLLDFTSVTVFFQTFKQL